MLKRSIVVLAAVLVVLLAAQPAAVASDFTDVGGHPSADAINAMHEAGIVMGDPDGKVRPDDPITRVEFMALLLRTEDIAADGVGEMPFVDVPADHWGYKLVVAAKASGITNGIDETHFGPAANVTREQAIAMIMRASQSTETEQSPRIAFSDVEEGRWSLGYIADASTAGIIESDGSTAFRPSAPATRAEVISWLSGLLDAETKAEFLPSDAELIQAVETYERTQAEVFNAGYPFDWDRITDLSVGAASELIAAVRPIYDFGGVRGATWAFDMPVFTGSEVFQKGQHMAVVGTQVAIKVTTTGADGTRATIETSKIVFYGLRKVDGAWKVFKAEAMVEQNNPVTP